jgi:hypothetical protein
VSTSDGIGALLSFFICIKEKSHIALQQMAEQKIMGSTTITFDGYKLWILKIAVWAWENQARQLLLEAKISCQL